jgi:cation diffusion facilitator CzcD-associated flavoprotein CzcO
LIESSRVYLLFNAALKRPLSDTILINFTMSLDTEVLIIGAGMSGLGLAVQIIRKFGIRNFELIEKSEDVGGTWLANTYPGCGCDVSFQLAT